MTWDQGITPKGLAYPILFQWKGPILDPMCQRIFVWWCSEEDPFLLWPLEHSPIRNEDYLAWAATLGMVKWVEKIPTLDCCSSWFLTFLCNSSNFNCLLELFSLFIIFKGTQSHCISETGGINK